jgi:hypothetical protein
LIYIGFLLGSAYRAALPVLTRGETVCGCTCWQLNNVAWSMLMAQHGRNRAGWGNFLVDTDFYQLIVQPWSLWPVLEKFACMVISAMI